MADKIKILDDAGLEIYRQLQKTELENVDKKIGTLADLDTTAKTDLVTAVNEVRAAVDAGGTGSQVTITTDTTTEGYLKTYTIKQGSTVIGIIDIPKDLVVTSGEVVADPDGQPTGTYVKLTIANQSTPIYINVVDLVDVYTVQASAVQIQLAISDTNEISATIVAGSVGTTELTDESVTLAKLATDVTDVIDDITERVETLETQFEAITEDEINALFA